MQNTEITISVKKGGFVLTTYFSDGRMQDEIFVSQQKLIKAIKERLDTLQPDQQGS